MILEVPPNAGWGEVVKVGVKSWVGFFMSRQSKGNLSVTSSLQVSSNVCSWYIAGKLSVFWNAVAALFAPSQHSPL